MSSQLRCVFWNAMEPCDRKSTDKPPLQNQKNRACGALHTPRNFETPKPTFTPPVLQSRKGAKGDISCWNWIDGFFRAFGV